MVYPDKINGLIDVVGTDTLAAAGHSVRHNDVNDALREIRDAGIAPNRNLIYNGAMQVHQRGTSVTGITQSGYYTTDRWRLFLITGAVGGWTQTSETDAPTGSGFGKSTKMLCTTAESSPPANAALFVQQRLEGHDLQRMKKGTAAAEQVTLSFWVKSNVTGTYIAELSDFDNTRQVSAQYTISASGTWEKKTIALPADTTGAFDNDNGRSLDCNFGLVSGTNFTSGTLNTTWGSVVNANRFVGQTNLAAATDNYWQITGVQLEVGPVATGFEFKSFGQEVRECKRYYHRMTPGAQALFGTGWNSSTTISQVFVSFPVPMRTAPSALEQTGTASDYRIAHAATVTDCSVAPAFVSASILGAQVQFQVASGLTAGQGSAGRSNATAAFLAWSAEL